MQTFLPWHDFRDCARDLDRARLGKQRVEVLQILNALSDPEYGWQRHPAVRMWRGSELKLIDYGLIMCDEWINRGYRDTCADRIAAMAYHWPDRDDDQTQPPRWALLTDGMGLGWAARLHASHRAALYRKDPEHYAKYADTFTPEDAAGYWWPTEHGFDEQAFVYRVSASASRQ